MKRLLLPLLCLAAYTGAQAAEPAAAPNGDPAKGKAIATTVCAACHNADGNSLIPTNPKLAGQHEGYLFKQLRNFKGEGGKAPERVNPIMNGMVAAFDEATLRDLAAYFASQKFNPEVAKNRDTVELAQKLYRGGNPAKGVPACAGCHGPTGAGIPAQYPRIYGQYADYTEAQLKAFRLGDRANDPNKMMRSIADRLSDADIKALADYVAGLR